MDGWTEVFTDQNGVRRCKRCQHARPFQSPGGLEDTPQQPLDEADKARRVVTMQRKMQIKYLNDLRNLAIGGIAQSS